MDERRHARPGVLVLGKKRKAYLIAFIDDATRVIPYAAFTLSESTAAFLPVLKEAALRRGVCRRLFVDNGSAFRSHQLALACAKLGITLIHARDYHAQANAFAERFVLSIKSECLDKLVPLGERHLRAAAPPAGSPRPGGARDPAAPTRRAGGAR